GDGVKSRDRDGKPNEDLIAEASKAKNIYSREV
ncbi:MAG: hypothetical protein JWN56_1348, partial [Sphingobacteriales bacterium]|nr:hypothetical protein [Sphingobacteriales bacterium]